MLAAGGLNWHGSPQHVVVGAILAFVVVNVVRTGRLRLPVWAAFVLAVGVVCSLEIVWELAEYKVRYAAHPYSSAYYDTLVDLGSSLGGAIVGAAFGALVRAG